MKKTEAIQFLRQFVGVKFRHQGRNPKTGLDCIGLGRLYAGALGKRLMDREGYSRDPDGTLYPSICYIMGEPAYQGRGCGIHAAAGDVVMMDFAKQAGKPIPRHVAMVSEIGGIPHLIHADAKRRRVVEHRLDEKWASDIVAVWRHRE